MVSSREGELTFYTTSHYDDHCASYNLPLSCFVPQKGSDVRCVYRVVSKLTVLPIYGMTNLFYILHRTAAFSLVIGC
jgi:hypothetical protein